VAKHRPQHGSTRPKPRTGVTWAQAARDVFIAAINKGQLPILGIILIVLLVVWRMPPDDLVHLTNEVVNDLASRELLGYAISLIFCIGWYFHARWMRRDFSQEYERIGREKSEAQSKAAGKKFPSSEK